MNLKFGKYNSGMTYVELIVVLSIFAVLSSVAIFNYSTFQETIDIKNLSSDIALEIVQARNSSLSGTLPVSGYSPTWKPSYGVYFNSSSVKDSDGLPFDQKFIYFADLNDNNIYDGTTTCSGECVQKYTISKGDIVSNLSVFYKNDSTEHYVNNLTITFIRPDSDATVLSGVTKLSNVDYVQISITSPKGLTSEIQLYPSGRVQVI